MWRSFALPVLAVLLTSGCSSLGLMTPPDVSLVDLEFTDMTVFETTGAVTVRITNENPEPLVIEGSVFKLYLNGVAVGKGLASERVEVPRLGTMTQAVNVHISNVALVARLASMLEQPELDYRIKTRLWVERPYGTRKVRLDHSGRFSFDEDGRFDADIGGVDELVPEGVRDGAS